MLKYILRLRTRFWDIFHEEAYVDCTIRLENLLFNQFFKGKFPKHKRKLAVRKSMKISRIVEILSYFWRLYLAVGI